MTFPERPFEHIAEYADAYFKQVRDAAASVDRAQLATALEIVEDAYEHRRWLYACGNGGSAAIANHLVRDHMKGASTDTDLLPRVQSLATNIEAVTAIADDHGYDDVFAYQLSTLAHPDDVLLTVSPTGDAESVVRACAWARTNGLRTIAMTGFDGGRTARLADVDLHVASDNRGVIQDVHQSLMHILAQYIRQARMPAEQVVAKVF
jgi:D-sedoheptulose 7-phosphate isomerase